MSCITRRSRRRRREEKDKEGLAVELAIPQTNANAKYHASIRTSPAQEHRTLPTVQEGSKGAGELTPVLVAAVSLPGRAAPAPMGSQWAHWPFTRALVLALRCRDALALLRFALVLRPSLWPLAALGSAFPHPTPQKPNPLYCSIIYLLCDPRVSGIWVRK